MGHRCLDHSDLLLHQDTDIMDPLLRDTMALHLLRVLNMDLLLVLNMDLHLLRVLNMDHLHHSTPARAVPSTTPSLTSTTAGTLSTGTSLSTPTYPGGEKVVGDLLTYMKYIFYI